MEKLTGFTNNEEIVTVSRQKPTNPDTPDWTLSPQQEAVLAEQQRQGERRRAALFAAL